jgi:DNA-binding NarL/FixJ family response regulator
MEKIRVLIVDDHPLLRQALIRTLYGLGDIEVVGEGSNGIEAVEKARELKPDVIILDLGLPGKNGVQATAEIMKDNPNAHILIFSGIEDQATILNAVQAGAIGFLEKANQDIDIADTVRRTAQGIKTLNNDLMQRMGERSKNEPKKIPYKDLLNAREQEIVDLIANGYSDESIVEMMTLSESAMKSHIESILGKLDLKSRPEIIRFVWMGGLEDSSVK